MRNERAVVVLLQGNPLRHRKTHPSAVRVEQGVVARPLRVADLTAAVIVRARVNGERNVSQAAVQRRFKGPCRPGRSSWPPSPSLVTSIGATSWVWAIEVGRSSSAVEVSQRSEKCACSETHFL
jgi:hypothetical protein